MSDSFPINLSGASSERTTNYEPPVHDNKPSGQTSVTVGAHKYSVKQDNLPTTNPAAIRTVIKQNLGEMSDRRVKDAARYFGSRAQLAERKVERAEKLLSNPRLGPIVKRIAAIGSFRIKTLQDIRHLASWKIEAAEYRGLANEIKLRLTPVADPKSASEFIKQSDAYKGQKAVVDGLANQIKTLRAENGKASQIAPLEGRLSSESMKLTRLERQLVANNYEQFTANLIDQIPNVSLDHSESTSETPQKSDLNNNGIHILQRDIAAIEDAPPAGIDRDGAIVPLIPVKEAVIDGITHQMAQGFGFYDASDGMLYMAKDDARYHDQVAVSGGNGGPVVMSLADGSGHGSSARPMAKRIAEEAHKHVADKLGQCTDLHSMLRTQLDGLRRANDAAAEDNIEGQTTFIQTAIVGNVLTGISVGDSRVFVFRPNADGSWTCLDPLQNTKGTLDAKEAGGQLNGIKEENGKYTELNATAAFAMYLEEGDVVFACSDGFVDNFNPSLNRVTPSSLSSEVETVEWELENPQHIALAQAYAKGTIEGLIRNCTTGEEINESLQSYIQENTLEKKLEFLTNPSRETEKTHRGKLDDAASCFTVYSPSRALEEAA